MASGSVNTDLSCPVWVQFFDPQTRLPYFYNVQTHERSEVDPDPKGDLLFTDPSSMAKEFVASHAEEVFIEAQAAEALWKQKPARVQVEYDPKAKGAYTQGNEEYNVWYGQFENNRVDRKDKEPASYRLNPDLDCGWTIADWKGAENGYFCLFFAKGCCSRGHSCKYHHHLPVLEDGTKDITHDIFGRERYVRHRDDMGGVGCFSTEGRTIFVGDLRFDRSQKNALQLVEQVLWEDFGVFGDIEEVRVLPTKAIAFVRYSLRASAEFAKIAMGNQRLGPSPFIQVKWAHEDPNPRAAKRQRTELLEKLDKFADQRIASMGLSEVELASLQLQASNMKSFTAPYPDTSGEYHSKSNVSGLPTYDELNIVTEAAAGEVKAIDEQADVTQNMDRLTAALARTDAMHWLGA